MPITKGTLSLLLTLVAVVAFAAVPATALGQSVGDEQYVDPFQGGENDQSGDNTQSQDTPVAPSEDQAVTQAPATPAEDATDPTATAAALPRTGAPLGGLVIVGAILAAAGFALRRAWPLPD